MARVQIVWDHIEGDVFYLTQAIFRSIGVYDYELSESVRDLNRWFEPGDSPRTLDITWGAYTPIDMESSIMKKIISKRKPTSTKTKKVTVTKKEPKKSMTSKQQASQAVDETPIDTTISLDDPELKQCFEWGISDARVRQKENYESCKPFVDLCLSILDKDPLDEDRLNKVIDCYYQGYLTIVQLGITEEEKK